MFVGGCTLQAAEAVAGAIGPTIDDGRWTMGPSEALSSPQSSIVHRPSSDPQPSTHGLDVLDGLESLVDKSLLRQETGDDGDLRFWMLETIREYALESLAQSGETEPLRKLHAGYYLALAEQAEPKLRGPEQRIWLERLEVEHDNMRAALAWSLSEPAATGAVNEDKESSQGIALLAVRLAGTLGLFWKVRGYASEGREWLSRALSANGAGPTELRAKALTAAGRLAFVQSDFPTARSLYEEGLAIWRDAGDKVGIAQSLNNLGNLAFHQGDYAMARSLYEESLATCRELGDKRGIVQSLNNLGVVALGQRDYGRARELLEESLAGLKDLGDRQAIGTSLDNIGNVAFSQGDYDGAKELFEESLALERELGDKEGSARALAHMGKVALRRHDNDVRALFEESLALRKELGDKVGISKCLAGLAATGCAQGKPEWGARLLGAAEAILQRVGAQLDPDDQSEYEYYVELARCKLDEAQFAAAREQGHAMAEEQAISYALDGNDGLGLRTIDDRR